MSTTFGIIITENGDEEEIEVAFRSNDGNMRWLNKLAKLLPDDSDWIDLIMQQPNETFTQFIQRVVDNES